MSLYLPLSDCELQAKIIVGDEYAFAELYQRYHSAIYGFIKKFVHSSALAEDLSQEVFIKIWQLRSRLGEIKSIRAYIFIMARNHSLNSIKKAFRSTVTMAEVVNGFTEERSHLEEDLLSKQYQQYLQKALAALPSRTREIFTLCREHGKSYDEVASALGISRNAVKNHMVGSMKILSAAIERDLGISLSLLLVLLYK